MHKQSWLNTLLELFFFQVQWAEQLISKKRQKRDYTHPYLNEALSKLNSNSKFKSIIHGKFKGFDSSGNLSTVLDEVKPLERVKRGDMKVPKQEERMFNDELWSQEWYLVGQMLTIQKYFNYILNIFSVS